MKKLALALAVFGLLVAGQGAQAVIGTVDDVPAATLLLPYFEVDLGNANSINTLFSVNNASATAVLAHVVVYSDLSVAVLDFNIYLTGYDVQTISMRDILVNGRVPVTASAGQDPGDAISPKGQLSQDINFASCSGQLPPPLLPASFVAHLQASLTGKPSSIFGGKCAGQVTSDNIARGYVTVDTVNNCTLRLPGDIGYFGAGGTGDVTNQNVLWGDFFYINTGQNFASGESLVHIEASATNPLTTTAGNYTFYGRYDAPTAWTAIDNREPLATNFAARYINGGVFDGGTSFVTWRDSKTNQLSFTCPATTGRPSWYPLGDEGITIFDETEQAELQQQFPFSPQPQTPTLVPFPAEAQRTKVGGDALPTSFSFGWMYLNLNTVITGNANPPIDPAAAQAWVETNMDANGRFSVGWDALALDNASAAVHFLPGGAAN